MPIPITTAEENVSIDLGQIQFDRSITAGAAPLPADMKEGALAINLVDRKLYTKDHNGAVITLGRDYTADIAAAQANAIASSNAYALAGDNAIKGGALDVALDTLLKLGNRLKTAEANITTANDNVSNLTKADVGLGNVENFGISDAIDENNSSQYASSAAVKVAYDRALLAQSNAESYADQVKSDILGGAPPEALDTLAELATQLSNDGDAIAAITTTLATKATITALNDGLALKIDKTSISSSIISSSETEVASSKAVLDALNAAKQYADTGLALKIDKSAISNDTDSQSETAVASSKAVADAKQQAINHANALVIGLAANLDYGQTF